LIDYEVLKQGDRRLFSGYFIYEKKVIWYYERQIGGRRVILYLNESLRTEEMTDYLSRIESYPEEYSEEDFYEKQHLFGTLAIITNVKDKSAKDIYHIYKSRSEIEQMFDVFKNLFEADRSYMQSDEAVEAWMLINFIAMHWYYKLLIALKQSGLNKKYSPKDIIIFLRDIHKIRINGKWYDEEKTKKTDEILKLIFQHIT